MLDRYYHTAKKFNADIIIRVTADDPFKDYRLIDKAVKILKENIILFLTIKATY